VLNFDIDMRCPTLEEIPKPSSREQGWPWTVATARLPETMSDGRPWPRISIVTPSYNQANYLEETIRSILLQGYPNLEYLVIDGGSTDASREIILKYQDWLSFWVSEPDEGQSCAINKGLQRITGELFNWINSDDVLLPHSLQTIAESHRLNPDSLLAADVLYRDERSGKETTVQQKHIDFRNMVEFWNNTASFHQPGIFIPVHLLKQIGTLDERLHYAFDYELFCRLLSIAASVTYLAEPVATYRIHPASKSVSQSHSFLPELFAASRRHWPMIPDLDLPASDPKGSGLLFRVGWWQVLHREPKGADLVREALRIDPISAICSSVRYFPGWLWRRCIRLASHAS
jgi:glycosyltransferase involved in cell wall biosynthesis